jgi:hypothetical protein
LREGANTPIDRIYDDGRLRFSYSSRLSPSDWCIKVDKIGVVFSISCSNELAPRSLCKGTVTISIQGGLLRRVFPHAKAIEPQVALTGQRIPERLYFLIPKWGDLHPDVIRESVLDIEEFVPGDDSSPMAVFSVVH